MEVEAEATPKEIPNETLQNVIEEKSPPPQQQDVPKKSRNDKSKKDEKNVELFMKSLNCKSVDEKLLLACKKYISVTDENKKLQFYIKQSDKRYALLLKEKEQLQHEYNKTVLVKSKLENLCRELQKQNKSIKEESLTKIREEEERRKETQAKFQNTLSEITTLLQQNNETNSKLRDDNIVVTEKFKSVVQQYQLLEEQVVKMAKQMNLESQLSEAKLQKASLEHQADRERLEAELEQMGMILHKNRLKVLELQEVETSLKAQLAVYSSTYDDLQNALVKSNQVFGRSKDQIEKLLKKLLKLEKEAATWKKRWESSQAALLDMCSERQSAGRRLLSLQGLCRTLQAERTTLLNTLKEHNIERPPLPPPSPPQASDEKVEIMAANCATLKQSIAHLQNQINVYTDKKEDEPKPAKQKKSKSKKNKSEKAQKEKEPVPETSAEVNDDELNIDKVEDLGLEDNSETIETLLKAINMAKINLNDIEIGDNKNDKPNGIEIIELNDEEGDSTSGADCQEVIAKEPVDSTSGAVCQEVIAKEAVDSTSGADGQEVIAKEAVDSTSGADGQEVIAKEAVDSTSGAVCQEVIAQKAVCEKEIAQNFSTEDVKTSETPTPSSTNVNLEKDNSNTTDTTNVTGATVATDATFATKATVVTNEANLNK